MKKYATRCPNRVSVTARANRNAENTSHTVRFENPASTRAGGSVFVSASTVIAVTAETPIGTGCATSATIVATNTASRCRWSAVRPSTGTNHRATPGTSTTAQRAVLRVLCVLCGKDGTAEDAEDAEETSAVELMAAPAPEGARCATGVARRDRWCSPR